MIKELIQTAKSVDLAIELGCENLGVPRDQVQFEIIDLPKKKFFGMKMTPAKVRVYVELPDEAPASPAPAEAAAQKPAQQPKRDHKPEGKSQRKGGSQPQRKAEQQSAPQKAEAQQPSDTPIEPDPQMAAKAAAVVDYLKNVLAEMGYQQVEVTHRFTTNGASFTLSGADLGAIIGRRGETLDALQYLCSLVANRLEGEYLRVTIDSGNYREKREKTLQGLARRLALSVVRTGKSCTLEPMNPYERRIIHAAVSQIKGATSSSVGEEPNRRVVIKSVTGQPRSDGEKENRKSRKRGHGRKNREERQNAPRQQAAPSAAATPEQPAEKPKRTDADLPLYGKITLD